MPNGSAVPGLGRIVAASMVFGLVSAIFLAVLPFGGARENVIWGVALLVYQPTFTWPGLVIVLLGVPLFRYLERRNPATAPA